MDTQAIAMLRAVAASIKASMAEMQDGSPTNISKEKLDLQDLLVTALHEEALRVVAEVRCPARGLNILKLYCDRGVIMG
jgi:hypothetical protein